MSDQELDALINALTEPIATTIAYYFLINALTKLLLEEIFHFAQLMLKSLH